MAGFLVKNKNRTKTKEFDVIVVGAGAAGVGVAVVLKKLGLNYVILEKHSVGSSFKKWPKESRFISPSFTGNFFKMPDLNAISPDTSPAYNLLTEHPTGKEFAEYLEIVCEHYQLNVETKVRVKNLEKSKNSFALNTNKGEYRSKFVVWAGGEYQYPKANSFEGDHLCDHFSKVASFSGLQGKDRIVIGAYESGFDSAVNLVSAKKKVTVLDSTNYFDLINSDSSYSLSPFTRDRMVGASHGIDYHKNSRVKKVEFDKGMYIVRTENRKRFTSKYKPINCTGFDSSLSLVQEFFEFEQDYPLLNNFDESTKTKNLFLVGPQVKHRNALFCFIYKYRQRFAIVGERIAKRTKVSSKRLQEVLQEYKGNNFYLKDLSCCDDECAC